MCDAKSDASPRLTALLSAEVHLLFPLRFSLCPIMASLSLSVPSAPRPTPW